MKKLAVFGLVCGVGCSVIVLVRKRQSSEPLQEREEWRHKKRRGMFEKMQEGMEAMPKDFPPVVMFDNVAAIRETSERILKLLEKDRSRTEESVGSAAE